VTLFNQLRISGTGAIPTPNVYVFDPGNSPALCKPPSGYTYDPYRDAVHYDDQGYIFTGLPNANYGIGSNPTWTYTPVVAQVPVTSNGEGCQDIKSEITVLTSSSVTVPQGPIRPDGSPTGQPDGVNYYAWALIDPGALVLKAGESVSGSNFGFNHQKYGWFNQYLVAYLDGGRVPIVPGSSPPRMQTQRLFYPRSGLTPASANALGSGNDVMEFPRSDTANYSPVCQVISYASGPTPSRDAATIISLYGSTFQTPPPPTVQGGPITPTFIFCLQVQP
jgi:hypothetical protein